MSLEINNISNNIGCSKCMCNCLYEDAYETNEFSIQTQQWTCSKYKTVLKFNTDKNKLYIKFHHNSDFRDTAQINDNLSVRIQHYGYDLPINKHIQDERYDNPGSVVLSTIKNSNNVYVIELDIKNIILSDGSRAPLIKMREDEFAIYDYFIVVINGTPDNVNARFVTFSTLKI